MDLSTIMYTCRYPLSGPGLNDCDMIAVAESLSWSVSRCSSRVFSLSISRLIHRSPLKVHILVSQSYAMNSSQSESYRLPCFFLVSLIIPATHWLYLRSKQCLTVHRVKPRLAIKSNFHKLVCPPRLWAPEQCMQNIVEINMGKTHLLPTE